MEEIIHFFLDCLQVTGDGLAPKKCVCYLITHWCEVIISRMLQPRLHHRGISIFSKATGTVSGVKRKAPDEGHRTHGLYLAGGTSKSHKRVMMKKPRCAPKQLHKPACGEESV
jgi:hypothetical protein